MIETWCGKGKKGDRNNLEACRCIMTMMVKDRVQHSLLPWIVPDEVVLVLPFLNATVVAGPNGTRRHSLFNKSQFHS